MSAGPGDGEVPKTSARRRNRALSPRLSFTAMRIRPCIRRTAQPFTICRIRASAAQPVRRFCRPTGQPKRECGQGMAHAQSLARTTRPVAYLTPNCGSFTAADTRGRVVVQERPTPIVEVRTPLAKWCGSFFNSDSTVPVRTLVRKHLVPRCGVLRAAFEALSTECQVLSTTCGERGSRAASTLSRTSRCDGRQLLRLDFPWFREQSAPMI